MQETLKTGRIYYSRLRADGVWAELDAMFLAGDLKAHAHFFERAHPRGRNLQIKVFIAVFWIAILRIGERRFDLQGTDSLVGIRLGQRNPNPQSLCACRRSRNLRQISKLEGARRNIRP